MYNNLPLPEFGPDDQSGSRCAMAHSLHRHLEHQAHLEHMEHLEQLEHLEHLE